jgi:hypothetical protein
MGAEESHEPQPGPTVSATLRVAAADLRWCCDEAWLPFASTDEVEPLTEVVGQDDAIEALRFGLAISGPGQHIFVRVRQAPAGSPSSASSSMTSVRPVPWSTTAATSTTSPSPTTRDS